MRDAVARAIYERQVKWWQPRARSLKAKSWDKLGRMDKEYYQQLAAAAIVAMHRNQASAEQHFIEGKD